MSYFPVDMATAAISGANTSVELDIQDCHILDDADGCLPEYQELVQLDLENGLKVEKGNESRNDEHSSFIKKLWTTLTLSILGAQGNSNQNGKSHNR